MTRAIADTSLFIAHESGRPLVRARLPDEIAVSIVTIGELQAGVLAAADLATRARRLATLERARSLDPVPVDEDVAAAWARLRVELRDAGRSMPANDSWIAATAIAQGVPVVTQDDDYTDIPGLVALVV